MTLAAGSMAVAMVTAACGGGTEFEDRTARVEIDGSTVTFDVDSCGLDAQTVFVVGHTGTGRILQAVMGLEDDGTTGDVELTGLSVDLDGRTWEAFGAESWRMRSGTGAAPGKVTGSRLRGSRVQVEGLASSDGEQVPFSLDARCDQLE